MPRFCFNWSFTGATIVEAETLDDAQSIFDAMSNARVLEGMDDMTQHTTVESTPGCFDEIRED